MDITYENGVYIIEYVVDETLQYAHLDDPTYISTEHKSIVELTEDGFMINEDGEGDCFLQGCSSLEEVIISGAGLIIISDGFNYCSNLKRLIFENVGGILLFDGFKGTTNLDNIIIKGDTTGKSIDFYNIDKEIIYMN